MSDFGELKAVLNGRKDYRCAWCGENIPQGTPHQHYAGMWDGDWQNWRMHPECYNDVDMDDQLDGFTLYDHERPVPVQEEK